MKIPKKIRRLYCRVVEWEEEASFYSPGARWIYGGEYWAVPMKAIVPIWIKRVNEDEYIENHVDEDIYVD
jgi:hypothetical protein